MTPDVVLELAVEELSVEQLISALNKKLFIELTTVQSKVPPASRTFTAASTAEVDALETRAKDVLQEVLTLRNSLRPVNRLPPEVITLCAIFISDTDPSPIVPLTHVCRYWRGAITSSPRIWKSIGSGWERLVPLCLERSAAVPLSVKISISDIGMDEDFLQALLPHTSKISHLSLLESLSIENTTAEFPDFFASPMPSLTSLELEQTSQPVEAFPLDAASAPSLFQSVSKLKSLHLTRIPLYPTIFSITSLVELKLFDYEAPFHFGKLIKFLHSNQNLELVNLDLQFTEESVRDVPEKRASLPQLRSLVFTNGSATDVRALLSSVSLRHGSHIKIQEFPPDPRTTLASFLPSPLTPIQELLNPVTTIKYCPFGWLHIFGGDGQLSFQSSSPKSYGGLDLFATGVVREFHADVDSLNLGGNSLSLLLRRLPALEALAFSGTNLPAGLLFPLAEEPALCPSLKTIAFFDCKVTKSVVGELEEVLAKRRDLTAAWLYRVVIVNHTRALPDFQLIHQLRKFVPRVDVRVSSELPDLL